MSRTTVDLLLVAIVTCLGPASLVRTQNIGEWNTWPKIVLPRLTLQVTESNAEKSDPSRTHNLEFEGEPVLDLKVIERSLSFQKASAKNLSEVQRTHIKIKESDVPLNLTLLRGSDHVSDKVSGKSRRKRHIFGADTRYQITEQYRKIFPFSAAVQLSSGCSGILIGPRQVLTAAECIHTGKRYRGSAKNLRVGLVQIANNTLPTDTSPNEVRKAKDAESLVWYEVAEIYLPNAWVSPSFGENPDHSNYAVLELAEDHKHNCMEVGVSSITNTDYRQRIHYSSFDTFDYHPDPLLTYRHCYVVDDTTKYLYEQCDATRSSVGAGLYLRLWDAEEWKWVRRVTAIKTSDTSRIRINGKREKAHRDVRITVLNFAQICFWVMRDFEACSRGRIEDACLMA